MQEKKLEISRLIQLNLLMEGKSKSNRARLKEKPTRPLSMPSIQGVKEETKKEKEIREPKERI